jgi:uncharacterized protein (TIGR00369 family)
MADDFPTVEKMNDWNKGKLPGLLGVQIVSVEPGRVRGRLEVRPDIVAHTGFLSAPTVIGLADTLCAYGVSTKWPEGANGFTTAELKCNFTGTVQSGAIACTAELLHGGRTTQVWDATVTNEQTGKLLAAFRCTQIILYPRAT